jgi:hypothetical protein
MTRDWRTAIIGLMILNGCAATTPTKEPARHPAPMPTTVGATPISPPLAGGGAPSASEGPATAPAAAAANASEDPAIVPDVAAPSAETKPKAKNVRPHVLDSLAVYKPDPRRPPEFRGIHQTLLFKLCVGVDGSVTQVSPLFGSPRDNIGAPEKELDAVMAVLRTWKFRQPETPICSLVRFIYN